MSAFSSETSEAMARSSMRIRRARSTTMTPDSVRVPVERFDQFRAQFGFEASDPVRDVGLHGAQRLRGAARRCRGRQCPPGPLTDESPFIYYTDGRYLCYSLERYEKPGHTYSSLLYSNPPLSNRKVLQKDQPPPGWSFCLFWPLLALPDARTSLRDAFAAGAVRTVNRFPV